MSRAYSREGGAALAAVAALSAAHLGVDAVAGSVTALLPALKERFGLGATHVGLLVATFSVSSLMAQPLMGRVADKLGAKRVAVAGAVSTSALFGLIGVAPHLLAVFALVVLGGLGAAGFHPAAAVIARRVLPGQGQLAVSMFSAGGMLGLAFGPLLTLLVSSQLGMGFTPLVMTPGLVVAVLLWRLLPADPASAGAVVRGASARELLRGPVGPLALAATLLAVAITTFNAGLPLWLTEQKGYADDASVIGMTLAVFQLAAAVGGLAAGWAASRVLPSRISSLTLLASFAPLWLVLQLEPGTPAFFLASGLAGALAAAAMPQLIVAAQDHAPDDVAAASGIIMGLSVGAAGVAFVAIGAVADLAGLRAALLLGFSTVLPGAAVALRALRSSAPGRRVVGVVPAGGCCGVHDVVEDAAVYDGAGAEWAVAG